MDVTSRRTFLRSAAVTIGLTPFYLHNRLLHGGESSRQSLSGTSRVPLECVFESTTKYQDPYNEVSLDVEVFDPQGGRQLVPAYWVGAQTWRLRYSPDHAGRYSFRTVCSDTSNRSLHDQSGTILI